MLYVIAGNGTGNNTEITKALTDLREAATKEDAEFWLLVEGKDEPSKTDEAIQKWCRSKNVWFETYTSTGTTVEGASESQNVDDVFPAMLERMQAVQESEQAVLLALPIDPDGNDDADAPLLVLIEQVSDAGFDIYQLNGQMVKISLEAEEAEPDTPAPAAGATKKAATKAAGATKKAAAPAKAAGATKKAAPPADEQNGAPNDPDPDEVVVYTREELTKMGVPELGGIARGQGIDTAKMGKKDLIEAILAAFAALVPALTNGDATVGEGSALVVVHYGGQILTLSMEAEAALALVRG